MGYLFAPEGSGVAGSAAKTLTESWAAMAAGIAPEIAMKVRRERDAPGVNEYFILIQDRRRWFFLGNAGRILFATALRNPKLVTGLPNSRKRGSRKQSTINIVTNEKQQDEEQHHHPNQHWLSQRSPHSGWDVALGPVSV